MTTPGSLQSVSAIMTNETNGAVTVYTITFITYIPLLNGDVFEIIFPVEIIPPLNSKLTCAPLKTV